MTEVVEFNVCYVVIYVLMHYSALIVNNQTFSTLLQKIYRKLIQILSRKNLNSKAT